MGNGGGGGSLTHGVVEGEGRGSVRWTGAAAELAEGVCVYGSSVGMTWRGLSSVASRAVLGASSAIGWGLACLGGAAADLRRK